MATEVKGETFKVRPHRAPVDGATHAEKPTNSEPVPSKNFGGGMRPAAGYPERLVWKMDWEGEWRGKRKGNIRKRT